MATMGAQKLYRAYFKQPNYVDHEALMLVPCNIPNAFQGKLHHVIGMMALGMDYQIRHTKDARKEKGYSHRVLLGELTSVDQFESICLSVEPPIDERLLFTTRDKLVAQGEQIRDCACWIDEVLAKLKNQGVLINYCDEGALFDNDRDNSSSKALGTPVFG